MAQTVFLDTETTGLDPRVDEVLQVGILNDDGTVLLDSYVQPVRHDYWPQAQRIHGISPGMVSEAPILSVLGPVINRLTLGKDVVIYNANFDHGFLIYWLTAARGIHCCMRRYAEHVGIWDDYREAYKWHKLADAAAAVGFVWPDGGAHRAIADCMATRAVWNYLREKGKVI